MKFAAPLIPGRLVRRYKRFFADVTLDDGTEVTAHCANTGAMTGIKEPGLRVWLSQSDNPKRKLKYTWELVEAEGTLIGALPNAANALAEEAVRAGTIAELAGHDSLRREVRYGENSRIDLLLENAGEPPCWVEVKNVHWQRALGVAEFPDGVTSRGAKHLGELSARAAVGDGPSSSSSCSAATATPCARPRTSTRSMPGRCGMPRRPAWKCWPMRATFAPTGFPSPAR